MEREKNKDRHKRVKRRLGVEKKKEERRLQDRRC